MSAPKFSIIIPTFNSAITLQKALNSVMEQTFTSLEIIIVDGNSKDNTLEIVTTNAKNDARIRYISENDKGIYDAMNKGVEMAKGQWLYFLGSDDTLIKNNILESIHIDLGDLEINNCDIIYGNVYLEQAHKLYDGQFNLDKILRRNISHQAMFFKRQIFERIGRFNLDYRTHADWDLNIRCFEDDQVRSCFTNRIVSSFAAGGASSNADISFLRNSLLPAKLREFDRKGKKYLRSISEYDQWWRLIRNSRLTDAGQFQLPDVIKNIITFQQKIPNNIKHKGIFSKLLMTTSFIYQRLINSL